MTEAYVSLQPHGSIVSGVDVNTSVNHIHVTVNDRGLDLHIPHVRYLSSNAWRCTWNTMAKVCGTIYPIPVCVVLLCAVASSVYVWHAPANARVHTHPVAVTLRYLDSLIPFVNLIPRRYQATALCVKVWTFTLVASTVVHRFALRKLLTYRGWQTERQPNKPGLITRSWAAVLGTFFTHQNIRITDIYESCLPSPPLPPLQQTVSKYLASMRAVLRQHPSSDDWRELRQAAESFLIAEGPILQRHLRIHHALSPNYVAEWWVRNVFLAARASLCLYSNFYTVPFASFKPTAMPEARAAVLTYNLVQLKKKLDHRLLRPLFGGPKRAVPLTVQRMMMAFNTTRIPGREIDSLDHDSSAENSYIVVINQGCIYQVPVRHPKTHKWLTPHELERIFRQLREEVEEELSTGRDEAMEESDSDVPVEKLKKRRSYRMAEALLPALTTAPRAQWADLRSQYLLNDANNSFPLRIIEKSLFVLTFDAEKCDATSPGENLDSQCTRYLVGNGSNLWCDKSFNVVICSDAAVGVHVEQSWCDVQTFLAMFEYVVAQEESCEQYEEDGHAKKLPGDMKIRSFTEFDEILAPRRLHFQIRKKLGAAIREAYHAFLTEVRSDVELRVVRYDRYGKNLLRRLGVSPDSWVQMAVQLAHYKDQNHTCHQVYEAISMRAFAQGHTEAHRSVSDQSSAFVRAMLNEECTAAERMQLLREACDVHASLIQDASAGQGVDRHLFALYMISAATHIPSAFLNIVLRKSKWKVSSLQVHQRYLPDHYHSVRDRRPFETPACGLGPVSYDGYGLSYCFNGDGLLYFTITCRKSCEATSAAAFSKQLADSLDALADLVCVDEAALPGKAVPFERLQELARTAPTNRFNW